MEVVHWLKQRLLRDYNRGVKRLEQRQLRVLNRSCLQVRIEVVQRLEQRLFTGQNRGCLEVRMRLFTGQNRGC